MKRSLSALDHAALDGTRALVRVDFNCPIEGGVVTDATRIRAALPTIQYLKERGARVVLVSHLGRPKGKRNPSYSLQPVVRELERLLGAPVTFIEDPTAPEGVAITTRLPRGGVAVVDALGDFFVNDAFGAAHRAHATTSAVAHLLKPAVTGFLMERELKYLGAALEHPARPFVAILGGAKISGKIDLIGTLLPKVDHLLIGGAMACTFFQAMGLEVGTSLVEPDRVPLARDLLDAANEKLVLPRGAVIAKLLEPNAVTREVSRDAIPAGWAMYDIDGRTLQASMGARFRTTATRSARPGRCSGMDPWACLKRRHSIARPWVWLRPWPRRRRVVP